MTDSTMVERVAKAIGDECYGWVDARETPNTWAISVDAARAAIEAMMEPTPAALMAAQTDTDPDIARVAHENRAKLYSEPF